MTTRYTDDEWENIINQAELNLPSTPVEYKAPNLGSEEFAKTIDHTILKLDATKEQVDAICEEARRFNFKVHRLYHARILQTHGAQLLLSTILAAQHWVVELHENTLARGADQFLVVSLCTSEMGKSRRSQFTWQLRGCSLCRRIP